MPIVLITESLLLRSGLTDGTILRDRMLSGFCIRMNARKRTFRVATSVAGKQFRMNLGYWPLMSVEEARSRALEILRECRAGRRPYLPPRDTKIAPLLSQVLADYCAAKSIKESSRRRYESLIRTHFSEWITLPVTALQDPRFFSHCNTFAGSKGAALVELTRGLWGALLKYIGAVHDIQIASPFTKLAAAGLMPARSQPRSRVLQEGDLPAWRLGIDQLPGAQRDFLYLALYTGLRRNEVGDLRRDQIDLTKGVLRIPETKNGKPHTLPITLVMREILDRRCEESAPCEALFSGVSAGHLAQMASRAGAPTFMMHDLRKLLATVGERLGVGDAALRRILNHTPAKSDVLHRHYVQLSIQDVSQPLELIQQDLQRLLGIAPGIATGIACEVQK
ncbi:tyrosine-type recombinase/integrase [Diaphorobacter sp. HDW4A]|uniref:tyrosine-type recombinase/integrase n=1 Tax=Diaphorobacter sp. HDW4A TaxID=2714924 RepID=UPI00140C4469|nr:tyrosine-type recombinase/integrase [Diaphorobacter sp. HDW4A]QIL83411.1 tyrosine-type recombinase/integrase [Diaphorobacter sp. HDW4A]